MGAPFQMTSSSNEQFLNQRDARQKLVIEASLETQQKNLDEILKTYTNDPDVGKVMDAVQKIQDGKKLRAVLILIQVYMDQNLNTNNEINTNDLEMTPPGSAGRWAAGIAARLAQMRKMGL